MSDKETDYKVALNCSELVESMKRMSKALESFSVKIEKPPNKEHPPQEHPTVMFHQSQMTPAQKWIWGNLPIIIAMVLSIPFLLVIFSEIRSCKQSNPTDTSQKQILDHVAKDREEMERKIDELQSELFVYQERLDAIDEQVQQSAIEREKIHETIDSATTIRDIDNTIRGKGTRKPVKRTVNAVLRRPTESEGTSGGMDSNPY